MVVYKEFSSLVRDLGFSGKTLYSVSNHINKHYHPVRIPKKNGEYRQLNVPDDLLKAIQRKINNTLLQMEEISPYATAYRIGGSTRLNAYPHIGKGVLLKMDIRHFFDKLIFPLVKEKAFPVNRYSEQNRVLLTFLCTYKDALPQGAPTSSNISNIIMKDFDDKVGAWCADNGISYTRYCDDMTFSGDFDPTQVIHLVRKELRKMGLYINNKKTVIARKGQYQSVTGIVVNDKFSVPTAYKKKIKQEVYYCKKYGVESHMKNKQIEDTKEKYLLKLQGRINYVISIEPGNKVMTECKKWIIEERSCGL